MNIPSYATCSMCTGYEDDKLHPDCGTCVEYDKQVLGAIEAACLPKPKFFRLSIPWDAKPPCGCDGWQPNDEERRFQEEASTLVEALPMDDFQARNMEAGRRPGGGI